MSHAPGTPRRVLILAEDFAPGMAVSELALWLAGRGHAVEVVAAEGTRHGDAAGWWEVEERGGVRIIRCPRRRAALPHGLGYQLQHASFALSSAPILLDRALHFRPHLVAAFDPPRACLPALRLATRRARARSWIHLAEDAEPSPAALRRFDRVSVAAIDAEARLAGWGVAEKRRLALPPWVDHRAIFPLTGASPLRESLRLAPDAMVALYAGSLDERHRIGLLLEAARLVPATGAVIFVACGRGPAWARLEAAGETAPLRVLPWPRAQRINELLNLADLHLAPAGLARPDRLFPAKPAALLASGRPILVAGTEALPPSLRAAVRPVAAEPEALASAIIDLAVAPAERRERAAAARSAALDYHDKERVFRQIERDLGLRPAPGLAAAS